MFFFNKPQVIRLSADLTKNMYLDSSIHLYISEHEGESVEQAVLSSFH